MTAAPRLHVVLYDGTGGRPLPNRFDLVRALLEQGYPVTRAGGRRAEMGTGVISGPSPRKLPPSPFSGPSPRKLPPSPFPGDGSLLVLGRFTEQTPAEAEAGDGRPVMFRDIDGLEPDGVVRMVEEVRTAAGATKSGAWKPWFPVIDYSRCTNCMQCLTFCLFDVYGASKEHQIQVQNAAKCKTDCPACSRVCPEVAILFPKYSAGPINGDEVNQADVEREKLKVDISALLGGDIYAALRQRSEHARTRFGKERDDKRALDERKKCLLKLQQDLAIPPEVLAALPSADEIREKAARAIAAADRSVTASDAERGVGAPRAERADRGRDPGVIN